MRKSGKWPGITETLTKTITDFFFYFHVKVNID